MLIETGQTQKDKYHVFSYVETRKSGLNIKDGHLIKGKRTGGWGREERKRESSEQGGYDQNKIYAYVTVKPINLYS
jgi:hypothetical protein